MANAEDLIVARLKKEGFNKAAIASILGNWQVESGFDPNAYNANEGAIGFAQWEGGRRRNLDSLASTEGKPETDPNVQLDYFMQELKSSYPNVLQELNGLTDPQAGAAYFDQYYEGSAGTSRSQRVQDALSAFQNNLASVSTTGSNVATVPGTPATGNGYVATPALSLKDLGKLGLSATAGGLPGLLAGNPISNVTDALKEMLAPITFIGEFFRKLVWLFDPAHFVKFQLFSLGSLAVIIGIYFIVKGAGEDRPA